MLTCPNIQGFDLMTLGASASAVDHEHLNYFNPQSLSRLVGSCGLKVLETLTPGRLDAELVRNKILSGEFDVSNQPALKHILVDEWDKIGKSFQDFLAENNFSSHLWVVAKKL